MKVAYLGPAGTYSQEAAFQVYKEHTPVLASSLQEVIDLVADGHADSGLLPIENSTNGSVNQSVDALLNSYPRMRFRVVGDVKVNVRHQLYTTCKALHTIKTVYSHPQVWGQSEEWLKRNLPDAVKQDCNSTAKAVEIAMGDSTGAALAGPYTCEREALIDNCSDDPSNSTRFLILLPPQDDSVRSPSENSEFHIYGIIQGIELQELAPKINGRLKLLVPRPSAEPWVYNYYIEVIGTIDHPHWNILGAKDQVN